MNKIMKYHPFSFIFVLLYAWALLNFRVGTYVGILIVILYFIGLKVFKGEKERLFPLTNIIIILIVQLYALLARLYLVVYFPEAKVHGMEGAIGAGLLLMSFIVAAPFFSIFPTFNLAARVNKWYFLAILPSAAIAAYWYFYLYSIVGYY